MMDDARAAAICAVLSIMDGWPSMNFDTLEGCAINERYMTRLRRYPDSIAQTILDDVDIKFKKRPTVAELAEWADALTPPAEFKRTGVIPASHRLSGPMPVFRPTADAKAIIDQLRSSRVAEQPVSERGNWGLEYCYDEGRVQRMPARYSETRARQLAAEKAAKYRHVSVLVYCQGSFGNLDEAISEAVATEGELLPR